MHLLKVVVFMFVYFLPALINLIWQGGNQRSVFLINLFLGWTVIGWLVAAKKAYEGRKMFFP